MREARKYYGLFLLVGLVAISINFNPSIITAQEDYTKDAKGMFEMLSKEFNNKQAKGYDVKDVEVLLKLLGQTLKEKESIDISIRTLLENIKTKLGEATLPAIRGEENVSKEVNHSILDQKVVELQRLAEEKELKGVDVSKSRELGRMSLEAMRNGKPQETLRLLEEAIELLRKDGETRSSTMGKQPKKTDLSSEEKVTVELPVSSHKVLVTDAVLPYNSGKDIEGMKYVSMLNKKVLKATGGKVALRLSSSPIIVEEADTMSTPSKSANQIDSPFGIQDAKFDELDLLVDLGASWVRYAGQFGIVWDIIEPKRNEFNWFLNDDLYLKTYRKNIKMLVEIIPVNRWDQSVKGERPAHKFPRNLEAYKNFIRKMAERYDGDGIDDAPGSPIVEYWLIENEPDFLWEDDPKKLAELIKISYQEIKRSNKKAKIVMAGVAAPEGFPKFYIPLLERLDKIKDNPSDRYFDIFEFHWWVGGSGGYRETSFRGKKTDIAEFIETIRKELKKYKYNVPIWITEMASHSGTPKMKIKDFDINPETERQQATELFKRFIFPLSLGIKKILWSTITEWNNFNGEGPNSYFDTVGLINNPKNDGESHKKLAYYTYKLMTEKLDGVDWDKMEKLELGKGVFCYKLLKNHNPVYVLWTE